MTHSLTNTVLNELAFPVVLANEQGLIWYLNPAGHAATGLWPGGSLSEEPEWRETKTLTMLNGRQLPLKETSYGWVAAPSDKCAALLEPTVQLTDNLTGLANRGQFYQKAAAVLVDALAHGNTAGIVLVDLDRFKEVNDTMGHDAGDELLKNVAHHVGEELEGYATLARIGGDEFAIVAELSDGPASLNQLMRRVLSAVAKVHFTIAGRAVTASCSVGGSLFPTDGENLTDLLKHADIAMYQVKANGRSAALAYDSAMGEAAKRRMLLGQALKHAVANQELALYYQPQVSLASGEITGLEALLRWHSPTFGQIPPDLAIQLSEENGYGMQLSEWVFAEACKQQVKWDAEGRQAGTIAVNMSGTVLAYAGFSAMVSRVLEETGADPQRLEIEVTETAVIGPGASAALDELRGLGLGIALDDFGTGFSNLGVLGCLPLTKLKLDKVFLREYNNPRMALIAEHMARLAKGLGLSVVIEGVETYVQREFSKQIGADMMQGYLVSPPMPPSQVGLSFKELTLTQKMASLGHKD